MKIENTKDTQELIHFCKNSDFFSLIYENPEIEETVFRVNNQGEIYLVVYKKGFFWMISNSVTDIVYLNTSEMLEILSEDSKKFILFNLDHFK